VEEAEELAEDWKRGFRFHPRAAYSVFIQQVSIFLSRSSVVSHQSVISECRIPAESLLLTALDTGGWLLLGLAGAGDGCGCGWLGCGSVVLA
jgi:hypothetical protein